MSKIRYEIKKIDSDYLTQRQIGLDKIYSEIPTEQTCKYTQDKDTLDNKLISDSFIVFSAPSVMAFKPIQKGIPTILLNGYGQTGLFYDYTGLVNLDTQIIFDEIQRQYTNGKEKEFVLNTIKGGIDFSSTEKYVNVIKGLIV